MAEDLISPRIETLRSEHNLNDFSMPYSTISTKETGFETQLLASSRTTQPRQGRDSRVAALDPRESDTQVTLVDALRLNAHAHVTATIRNLNEISSPDADAGNRSLSEILDDAMSIMAELESIINFEGTDEWPVKDLQ